MSDEPQLVSSWLHHREIAAMKAAHPVHRHKAEGDGYEFIDGELEIAKVVGMAVAVQADKAMVLYDRMVGLADGPIIMATTKGIEDKLAKQLEQLDPIMQQSWTADTDKAVTKIIGRMSEAGARRAGAFRRFANLSTRATIEQGMVASTKYYSNTYFNRVVLPTMVNHINKQLAEGGAFDDTYFRTLRKTMETRLKSVPHWKLVGNQAASRAYHYGLARAGMADGYTGYTLRAVLDKRTTQVCRSLNGKTFWLADGVNRVEKVARMLPSRMKQDNPWLTFEDVDGKDTDQLRDEEILMPPFHGHCRTTIALNR